MRVPLRLEFLPLEAFMSCVSRSEKVLARRQRREDKCRDGGTGRARGARPEGPGTPACCGGGNYVLNIQPVLL